MLTQQTLFKTEASGEDTSSTYTVEVDRVDEAEWSAMLDDFQDANVYQTWAYGAVRWQESSLSHLVVRENGRVIAVAQLRIVRPGNLRFGIAYLRWGPLWQRQGSSLSPTTAKVVVRALHEEYVRRRGLHLEILPNAFVDSAEGEILSAAFASYRSIGGNKPVADENYRTFLVDLTPTLEELRAKLQKKWRNQLNAAERNGLEVKVGSERSLFEQFQQLYEEMWARKKFDTGVSVEEFLRIQDRLPDFQKMVALICYSEGRPVAGLVCSKLGNTAIYLLGATNDVGMKVKGSYLLQWTAIQLLKSSGTTAYDLGGIDPEGNPGVYHFKSGFSGKDVSHLGGVVACESRLSGAFVKTARVLRRSAR